MKWHYDLDTVQLAVFHGLFTQVIITFYSALWDQVQVFIAEVQVVVCIMCDGSNLSGAQEHRDPEAVSHSLEKY